MVMAIEETQTRSRVRAVYAAREGIPKLFKVMEAIQLLNEKVD
jgi:hypothetical protein